MQDSKTWDQMAGVEKAGLEKGGPDFQGWKSAIAGLENTGPILQGWKRQDHRVWNAKHHVIYIIGNMQRHTV